MCIINGNENLYALFLGFFVPHAKECLIPPNSIGFDAVPSERFLVFF